MYLNEKGLQLNGTSVMESNAIFAEEYVDSDLYGVIAEAVATAEFEKIKNAIVMAEADMLLKNKGNDAVIQESMNIINEGAGEKIREFFIKLWNAIKTIAAKAVEWVQSVFMSHKSFVTKYEAEIIKGAGMYNDDDDFSAPNTSALEKLALRAQRGAGNSSDAESAKSTASEIKTALADLKPSKLSASEFKSLVSLAVKDFKSENFKKIVDEIQKAKTETEKTVSGFTKAASRSDEYKDHGDAIKGAREHLSAVMSLMGLRTSAVRRLESIEYAACKKALSLSHGDAFAKEPGTRAAKNESTNIIDQYMNL